MEGKARDKNYRVWVVAVARTPLARRYPGEFAAWIDMLARCYDPTHPEYPNEGGRGISVDGIWLGLRGFEQFMRDIGPAPNPHAVV